MIRFKYWMNNKEIKEFVQQVAVIKELKPATSPNIRLDDTHHNEVLVGHQWIEINKETNPTLGFKLVKLKDKFKACELGCGEIVSNQVIESKVCTTPVPHWRTKCTNCDCFVSPDGKEFIKGGHAIQAAYSKHFNALGVVRDRHKKAKEPNKVYTIQAGEITAYERTKPSKYITDSEGNIRLNPDA